MHSLNTGLMTATFPTQIVGVAYNRDADDSTTPRITAFVAVEIDGVSHLCTVAKPSHRRFDTELSISSLTKWNEVVDNSEIVPRSVTLIAKAVKDVEGAAEFDITQIDLRTEQDAEHYFVDVIK